MNLIERMVGTNTECCANCQHFWQHYVYSEIPRPGFYATLAGHCCYPRLKARRPTDACIHFEPKKMNQGGEPTCKELLPSP